MTFETSPQLQPVSWNYRQIGFSLRNHASHVLENHLSRFLVFPLERRNDHSPNGCWFGESAAIVGSIEGAMLSASSCRSASSQSSTSWPSPCPLANKQFVCSSRNFIFSY